ncbi:lipase family protein [Sphingomonas sp. CBMAI 2297]|uniref:lipase family protein n=1 Tax=Sphingomonas sp. CBMAI 2297 TaxID=2991720 RepID=UPI0024570D1D|nr:lipase family protein [Sphingomonas sp. CBMAI 2297]MDH4746028.1 lipase family protein [Sphingomonas sp. CBMAI 2297]
MLRTLLSAILLLIALPATALAQRPAQRQAESPGTLISAEPVSGGTDAMRSWRIAYWTSDAQGRAIRVTGMIVAPRDRVPSPAPRRVIAWTHGTWGVVERCAPSLSPDFWQATPALAEMIARGYLVVAPDYPGLGSPMAHPYLIGIDTARAVLDAVRAARSLREARAGADFAVWGESQGGHAALWTGAEAARYAPELRLLGTAAAAPPTDLAANLRSGSDANVRAMLAAYAAYSWSRHFGHPLSSLFNKTNAGVATRLARNNCVELGKKPRLGTILGIAAIRGALRSKDMGSTPPWAGIARANSVAPGAVPGPLLIAQGSADTVVAPAVTLAFARQRCRAGAPLRYISLPGGDHGAAARDAGAARTTLDWIDARFAGARPPNDCGRI